MADLYYYEEGYIDAKYHVYVADAEIALGPYIEDGYIDANYYDDYSSVASLTCELTLRPGETVSATGSWTSEFTHTSTVGRLQSATADFTSAFSPTLTVIAFKNHTAIIESTTTFTVDAQANRSANVLLEHIANLNAQAAKTAVIDSTMATQATVSAQANRSVVSSATLTSTTTVTCLAFNVQFGTSSLVSNTSIFTSRYLGTGRPRTVAIVNEGLDFTTTSKYGSHALYNVSSSVSGEIQLQSVDTIPKANQTWVMEAYLKFVGIISGDIYFYRSGNFFIRISKNTDRTLTIRLIKGAATINITTSGSVSSSAFTHVAIVYVNGIFSVFLNGTRSATLNLNDHVATSDPWAGSTQILSPSLVMLSGTNDAIDEWSMHVDTNLGYDPNSTTITVPTEARINDPATTQFLFHFNNNYTDDIVLTQSTSAALSASASLSAQANASTKSASASLTSTATVSVAAGILQSAGAGLESAVTQSTNAVKTVQAVLDLTANVSVSVTAFRIKEFISNQNALFAPSIAVQAQLAGIALLESQFAQSASAVKTATTTTTITAVATTSASLTVTAGLAADLASTATVTATATRTQTANIALASAGTLTCEFTAFNNVTASFTSTVSVSADIERYRLTSSTLSTAVTITADVERYRLTSSTLSTTVSVTATATRIQNAESALSSVVTQSTVAVKTPGIGVNITANATVTATPIYTAEATATVGALFTPSMDVDAQFAGVALLESVSTFTALIGVIKQFRITGSTLGLAVTSTDPYIGSLTNQGFYGFSARKNEFTASIWARRNTVTGSPQPLWSGYDATFGGQATGALILDNDDVILRFNFGQAGGGEWYNIAPTDNQWHHYLIRTVSIIGNDQNTSNPGLANRWQLWIDGAYQGLNEFPGYQAAGQITFENDGRCLVGNGSIANLTPGYDINSRRLNGDVLQLWMGLTTDNQFNPNLFYDGGYQDLGSTGTLGGLLPTPKIYSSLTSPFTGITNAEGSGSLALNYDTVVARVTTAITANAVSLVIANTFVTATQTTLISYSVRPVITVTGSATLTVSVTAFTGIIANVVSTVTVVCDETKINGGSAAVSAVSTIQAVAGFFENFSSSLATAAALECDFDNIPPIRGEAALVATFTVSADAQSFTDSITMMMSMGTFTCDVTVIPPIRAEANLVTTATLTATIGSIEQFASLVMSAGTMTVTASKTTGIVLTVTAQAQLTATVKHFKGIILTVTAFNTVLTVGNVINIDPYLTLIILAESRGLRILPENREITIESETRVNII